VRRRLLDVRLQQQGSAQRQDSKAHVSDVAPPLQINAQQHVTSRGDRTFRCAPQNARRQTGDLKADAAEHMAEEQVLLEAIAATPGTDQLLLKRGRVKADGPL